MADGRETRRGPPPAAPLGAPPPSGVRRSPTPLDPGVRRSSAGLDPGVQRSPAGLDPDEQSGSVVAIMGGAARKGSWEPPARLRVLALMGGVELDFREADLLEGETHVEVLALMGGVNVVVPPDVHVLADGTGFLGGFSAASNQAAEPDAPVLRISGLAVMGGVEVKIKPLPLKKRLLGR